MPRIVRLYPRMVMGGAELHILQLLAAFPGSALVVPGVDGVAAEAARPLVSRYTRVERPRLAGTVRACRDADILHIHTINNDPVLGLAAQLSGADRIVQTIHNQISADYNLFADHSFAVGTDTIALQPAPGRVSTVVEGVRCPDVLPERTPWLGRPLRVLEVRRPDKDMAFTVAELLRAGAWDGVDVEVRVVGISDASDDPRLTHLGLVADARPHFAWADMVVHGSAAESFGRVVYEAMAFGALPVATPLPAFSQRLVHREQVWLTDDMTVAAGVRCVREAVGVLRDAARVAALIQANHRWVLAHASSAAMEHSYRAGYAALPAAPPVPRSIVADDVPDAHLDAFGAIVDALQYNAPIAPGAIDALPMRTRALAFWCLADFKRVNMATSLRLLRVARQVLGPRPTLLRSLAVTLRELGQRDEAATVFAAAIAADPAVVAPYLELAEHHIRRRNIGEARAVLQQLQSAVPAFPASQAYLDRLGQTAPRRPTPFAFLRQFSRIIVTGPHRSGTTIATEMIAADTGHEAILEEEFEYYREDLLRRTLERRGIVVQCPALFDLMPELSSPDTAIVLMRRPLSELAESRDRMFDPTTAQQLSADEQNRDQLARLGASSGDAAALKYSQWQAWVERRRVHHPVVVEYSSLAKHPMWVAPETRRKLGRQWHNRRTRV